MKSLIINWVNTFNIWRPVIGILNIPRYLRDFVVYRNLSKNEKVKINDTFPCLLDRTQTTPFNSHYFYQGAWLARKISKSTPSLHVDVGSSVMMISMLSAMTKTIFVDYRPLHMDIPEIISIGASITNLPFDNNCLESLSCQHVIEHIGLGRYGDAIDPEGTVRSAQELERILKVGGRLYLSLPIGRERVCFNAHRVLSPESVPSLFPKMKLIDFACVNDNGRFFDNSDMGSVRDDDYACGMYVLEKIL